MKGKAEDIGMKRLCSILLALLLLLGACSGEESKNGLPQENLPIGFSGVITMTRGTGKFATAGELKNVGVFAYFTHGKFNDERYLFLGFYQSNCMVCFSGGDRCRGILTDHSDPLKHEYKRPDIVPLPVLHPVSAAGHRRI